MQSREGARILFRLESSRKCQVEKNERRKTNMKVEALSTQFAVRKLLEEDIGAIYSLSKGNPLFYRYCPPFVTEKSIRMDMRALPPHTSGENKYYIGFFNGEILIAVMDLILGYPDEKTAFIGLFMMEKAYQGRGTGTQIITECAESLYRQGFRRLCLGFAKGNPQSEAFWRKNGFLPTGVETDGGGYTIVVMEKSLP